MISLSSLQVKEYAIPLVRETMGDEVAEAMLASYEDVEDVSTDLYGLFDMDKLIAVGGLGSTISPKKVWLGYWAVSPEYQGRGVGKRVLAFVEKLAKERGFTWILVETYESPQFSRAIEAYKKAGYSEVGYLADYLDDDSDAIYFRKRIE